MDTFGAGLGSPVLAVVGDTALDYYLPVPDEPWPDEKATSTGSSRLLGGTGANTAVAAARLGANVELHTVVGTDPTGQWLIEQLLAAGLSSATTAHAPGNSTQTTILLSPNRRQVIVDRGVISALAPDVERLQRADLVYISIAPPAVLALIADLGERVVAGIEAWMADDPALAQALRSVGLVVTNEPGWSRLASGLNGRVTTVVTLGIHGAAIYDRDGSVHRVPAIEVDVVDSTGAGDCFAGALCAAILDSRTLLDACRLACVAAGLSVQALGAQPAMPTMPDVLRHLQSSPDALIAGDAR